MTKIINCTNRNIEIYNSSCLEWDYDFRVINPDVDKVYTLYYGGRYPNLIPSISTVSDSTLPTYINEYLYDELPIPPEDYDYYIVNNLQYILYQKQGVDTSKMVMVYESVHSDLGNIIGYESLKLINHA